MRAGKLPVFRLQVFCWVGLDLNARGLGSVSGFYEGSLGVLVGSTKGSKRSPCYGRSLQGDIQKLPGAPSLHSCRMESGRGPGFMGFIGFIGLIGFRIIGFWVLGFGVWG